MANEYCKYHPLINAAWHCSTCHIYLCDDCVQPSVEQDVTPTCLLCGQLTTSLQQPKVVIPFWLQYTNFLRLPLSLLGIFLLVLLFILPQLLPSNLTIVATVLAYLIAVCYGSCLLQQAMTGTLKDVNAPTFIKSFNGLTIQLSVVTAIFMAGLDWLSDKMQGVAFLMSIGMALIFPAMLIGVMVERQITAFMQIHVLKDVISKLKFFYLPIVGASLLLWMFSAAITRLLVDVLSVTVAQGLEQTLSSYCIWVMMSIVGYVLYQFNQLFGLELTDKKVKRRVTPKVTNKQEARLEVFLKEGAYDKASSLLKKYGRETS